MERVIQYSSIYKIQMYIEWLFVSLSLEKEETKNGAA